MVIRLKADDACQAAPKPGEPMPPFAMPDEQGQMVTLDDLLREGLLAMAIFPIGDTGVPIAASTPRRSGEAPQRIVLGRGPHR